MSEAMEVEQVYDNEVEREDEDDMDREDENDMDREDEDDMDREDEDDMDREDEDEMEFYKNRCGCSRDCLSLFPTDIITEQRLAIKELSKDEKDLVLVGQIRAHRYFLTAIQIHSISLELYLPILDSQ